MAVGQEVGTGRDYAFTGLDAINQHTTACRRHKLDLPARDSGFGFVNNPDEHLIDRGVIGTPPWTACS